MITISNFLESIFFINKKAPFKIVIKYYIKVVFKKGGSSEFG